jgi:AraC-like DNA-binding protein
MLEITLKSSTGFIASFAELIGAKVEKGKVRIPKSKGSGYLQGFTFDRPISMMIRNYELNEALRSTRLAEPGAKEKILIFFNNVFSNRKDMVIAKSGSSVAKNLPTVQLGKGNIDFEMIYPGRTRFRSVLIAIDSDYLKSLLGAGDDHAIVRNIIGSDQPLLFEEGVSPQILKVASELIEANLPAVLTNFYARIKAEELVCLLFARLLQRDNTPVQAIHQNDLGEIYKVRDTIIFHLDEPPVLAALVQRAGMSESKLKRLFKQVFGSSIFNYYQQFRMQEAARLLREDHLSVSETGYRLGFYNLSHFGRVFEQHLGMMPKKYATGIRD